jgi:TonB family protein
VTTIFISYRRKDDPYAARGINDALVKQFGRENVYFDLDALLAGLDWREQIDRMVAQCDVMLVVIGDRWIQPDETGRSRLESADDLVRVEVSSALTRNIPVIPVLVGNADIPSEDVLPDDLTSLHYRQYVEVRATSRFNAEIQTLIRNIRAVVPQVPSPTRRLELGHWKKAIVSAAGAVAIALSIFFLMPKESDNTPIAGAEGEQHGSDAEVVEGARVNVPALVGQDVDQAVPILTRSGLVLARINLRESEGKFGAVLEQTPAPGAIVEVGSGVSIVVAGAPPPLADESDKGPGLTAPEEKDFLSDDGAGYAFDMPDYLPIVKVAPIYPQRALSRGIEGYCVVQYVVTRQGTIRDPFVIEDQCTSSLFHRASVQAALKFKYKPRIIDGEAVEVPGVQNTFTFKIEE